MVQGDLSAGPAPAGRVNCPPDVYPLISSNEPLGLNSTGAPSASPIASPINAPTEREILSLMVLVAI